MLLAREPIDTYRKQIRDFLVSNFYITETNLLEVDTSLLDQGIIDSTGVLEVIGFIEETFGSLSESRSGRSYMTPPHGCMGSTD